MFKDLIPKSSLNLVKYSGGQLIERLGADIISNVVLSILKGSNLRSLTEGLTQRRILLMNTSLFITYLSSPCEMQDTGQLAAHAPQLIHLSVILYAIYFTTSHFYISY